MDWDNIENYNPLAPLSFRSDWPRKNKTRYAEWLWSILHYAAYRKWASLDDALRFLEESLSEAGLYPTKAPLPPSFDLPSPATDWNGRGIRSKCRQDWWHRERDHKVWVRDKIAWLEDLLRCIGYLSTRYAEWQVALRAMLRVYEATDCGCNEIPRIPRQLRSGVESGLYLPETPSYPLPVPRIPTATKGVG